MRIPKTVMLIAACAAACLADNPVEADVNAMLNASAWQLEYEVSFSSNSSGQSQSLHGQMTYTTSVESKLTATLLLDMRVGGPSISTVRLATGWEGDSAPPLAEQQRLMMDLVMRSETMANWMSGGPTYDENASFEEQQAAALAHMENSKGTATVQTVNVTKGVGLHSEMGTPYDQTTRTTRTGTGRVNVSTQLSMELDATAKHYLLTLAHEYQDDENQAGVLTIDTTNFNREGPKETRTEGKAPLHVTSSIVIDDSTSKLGQILLVQGDLDPSATKITGERTIKALDGDVPGTLRVKFTLTPKP